MPAVLIRMPDCHYETHPYISLWNKNGWPPYLSCIDSMAFCIIKVNDVGWKYIYFVKKENKWTARGLAKTISEKIMNIGMF